MGSFGSEGIVMRRARIAKQTVCALWTLALLVLVGQVRAAEPPPQKPPAAKAPAAPTQATPPLSVFAPATPAPGTDPVNTQGASIFGVDVRGSKFVYVFDRSGSMDEPDGKPLKAAKAELMASIAELKDVQQFYIIPYNHEHRMLDVVGVRGRSVFATEANKANAARMIGAITADGATRHEAALATALKLRPDAIYLLTDGDEKDDLTASELERLERINFGAAIIHVIQFSPPTKGENRLIKLAKQTGGEHTYVDLLKFKRGQSNSQ